MTDKRLLPMLFIISIIIFLTGCAVPEAAVEEAEEPAVDAIETEIAEVDTLEEDLGTAELEEDLDSLEDFLDQI